MSRRQILGSLKSVLLVALAIGGLTSLLLAGMAVLEPEAVGQLAPGGNYLVTDLSGRTVSAEHLLGIKPLVDLPLLLGVYVMVCLMVRLQEQASSYLKNRSHFE